MRLAIGKQKEKTNSNSKISSEGNVKVQNHSSTETDKRKNFMRDNLGENEKEQLKKDYKKKKRKKCVITSRKKMKNIKERG